MTPGAALGPVLQTERLVMRPHGLDDFDDCLALWSDARTARFIGGRPSAEDEVWIRLLRYAGGWSLLGFSFWAVREHDGGGFVGEVGLFHGRRGLGPRFDDAPETGWAIAPAMQGRGLAGEALAAALAWADDRWARTVCMIDPENAPSLRLAERNGFRPFEEAQFKGAPTLLFERLRPS